ncbi:hypothetical protein, partial [Thiolapillus sp.]|uniref:hypothetical protein n=1 Tax=Thiolapillus sp. TaxID=2017437 RepID=UPI003AF70013
MSKAELILGLGCPKIYHEAEDTLVLAIFSQIWVFFNSLLGETICAKEGFSCFRCCSCFYPESL